MCNVSGLSSTSNIPIYVYVQNDIILNLICWFPWKFRSKYRKLCLPLSYHTNYKDYLFVPQSQITSTQLNLSYNLQINDLISGFHCIQNIYINLGKKLINFES